MGVEGKEVCKLGVFGDQLVGHCGLQARGDEGDAWDCESKLSGGYENIEQDLAISAKCSPDDERVGIALQPLATLDQFEGADGAEPSSKDKSDWREDEAAVCEGFWSKQHASSTVPFNERNIRLESGHLLNPSSSFCHSLPLFEHRPIKADE